MKGFIVSILSAIASNVIISISNFILYYDVIQRETENKLKAMNKLELIIVKGSELQCKFKLKQAKLKLKLIFLLLISNTNKLKLKNKLNTNADDTQNILKTSIISINNKSNSSSSLLNFTPMKKLNLLDSFYKKTTSINNTAIYQETKYKYGKNTSITNNTQNAIFKMDNNIYFECLSTNLNRDETNSTLHNINIGTRNYKYDECEYEDGYTVNCFYLNCIAIKNNKSTNKQTVRTTIKTALIFVILITIWFYLILLITYIYKHYGNNIFKVCVMPLISSLIINLFIITNILIFVSCLIMYYKGRIFYNNYKGSTLKKVLFNLIVSITASNNHQSLLMYRNIIDKLG